MRLPKHIGLELVVAGLTLAAAGAFTHAAVSGQAASIFTVVEQQATDLGQKIFLGKGNCHSCHGQNLKGTALAPNLTDPEWLHGDGSQQFIESTVRTGVPKPKKHPAPMPPMGGAKLSADEIQAVAGFIHARSQPAPAAKRP